MKNQTIITAILLSSLSFVGCEKSTEAPAPVKSCWECEVAKSTNPSNGMAGIITKTKASYCDKTAQEISKIETEGSGSREALEFGQVVRFGLVTKCSKK